MTPRPDTTLAERGFIGAAASGITSLYSLARELRWLLDFIETDEDPEVLSLSLERQLDSLTMDFRQKAENIAGLVRWCDSLARARKEEAKFHAAAAAMFERRAERLEEYVKKNMELLEIPEIHTGRFTIKVKQNPEKVVVTDESQIPAEFMNKVETWTVDKNRIKAHVKATGEVVPGVSIERATRLEVK